MTTLAILAGGASRRFGQDKASLRWRGRTLLERLADEGLRAGLAVLVVGRARPSDWHGPDATFVEDDLPGQGPLAALATALRHAPAGVVLTGSDQPALSASYLTWLQEVAGSPGSLAMVNGQAQPMGSWYGPECAARANHLIERGRRSVLALDLPPCVVPDCLAGQLEDCDTPEAWAQWQLDRRADAHPDR